VTITVSIEFFEELFLLPLIFGHTVVAHGFEKLRGLKSSTSIIIDTGEAASEALNASCTTLLQACPQLAKQIFVFLLVLGP